MPRPRFTPPGRRAILVKFEEGRRYSLVQTGGGPANTPGSNPIDWDGLWGVLPEGAMVRQSFPRIVNRLRGEGKLTAGPGPGSETSLDLYVRVGLPPGFAPETIVRILDNLPEVAFATIEPEWDMEPSSPAYAGETGINSVPVSGKHRGEGVMLCVLERSYYQDHALFQKAPNAKGKLGSLYPLPKGVLNLMHGTNTLGVLCPDNPKLRGICPDADVLVASTFSGPWSGTGSDCYRTPVHYAIDYVGGRLQGGKPKVPAGSLVLIEAAAKTKGGVQVPVDYAVDVRRCLRTFASVFGITVVLPAGNGGQDLGTILAPDLVDGTSLRIWLGGGPKIKRNHSLAVMVGAGDPEDHSRWVDDVSPGVGSNFGTRVDCQGWGRGVLTVGEIPDLTIEYGGTSAASAMVAGVITCMQGAAKPVGSLTPEHIRGMFGERDAQGNLKYGKGDKKGEIGPLPNLTKLIQAI